MDDFDRTIHDEVILTPWRQEWAEIFAAEKERIEEAFSISGFSVEVFHVGSTAVKGMAAKPIIDILVCPMTQAENCIPYLERIGYNNLGECGREGRYFLSKGNAPDQTFYVHLCTREHIVARDQLLFQRILRECFPVFENYLALKQELAEMFPDDRRQYRRLKSLYIASIISAFGYGLAQYGEDHIKYWIYELEMSPETEAVLKARLAELEMTLDELAEAAITAAMENPEKTKTMYEEYLKDPHANLGIRVVRTYPVFRGETEAMAKKRKLAEEAAEKASRNTEEENRNV